MPKIEERLKSPDTKELQSIRAKIDQAINDGADIELSEQEGVTLSETIEWVVTSLDNRRAYHKKRQLETKFELELMREAMKGKGGNFEALKKRAADLAANRVIDDSLDMSEERPNGNGRNEI